MLRLDRSATLYVFHPLVQRLWKSRPWRVPILMYHSISSDPENSAHPYFEISTAPDIFFEQMSFLKENGFQVVPLAKVVGDVLSRDPLPQRAVAITFDDGYRDFLTHAYPILQRFDFVASVFLPTQYIGKTALKFKGKECLTWSEARELSRAGIEFGSHTVSHPTLKALPFDQIEIELRHSRETIADELGVPVRSFAYPFAFPEADRSFCKRFRLALQSAGYDYGVSTILGTVLQGDDPLILPRIPVNTWDDLRFFQAKIEGGYNWLHPFQYATKVLKGIFS